MFDPATTVAGPTLVTAKSADGVVTDVLAVELLLAKGIGSDVVLDTVAVLDNVPLAVGLTCATTTKVAVEPAARLVHAAVIVLPLDPSVALGPVGCRALTKVSPVGSGSVIAALAAASGPLFTTVIV